MTRLELFEDTLEVTKELRVKNAWSELIPSVIDQLEYLIDLERGRCSDKSRLTTLTIGIITVREIEDLDKDVAEKLHSVSAEVKKMRTGG
jgi:hypothetical protein